MYVCIDRLSQQGRSSSALWRSLSSMLGRDREVSGTTGHTADGFTAFFRRKVDDVRASTASQPSPSVHDTAHSTLSSFRSWMEPEMRRLIMKSPIKSCSLDLIPTFLLQQLIDSMLPFITRMINASLRQGRLPDTQKHAIVTPLLTPSLPDDVCIRRRASVPRVPCMTYIYVLYTLVLCKPWQCRKRY